MAFTTTRGDTPRFSQQRTIDWGALAQKPVQFSLNVLARYSKAGIDLLTVSAGQAACTSWQIPLEKQQEFRQRISNLPSVALYGNVAWFGFGLKPVLFDLTNRDGGLECLVLCGCLAESFSTFYGAQVLQGLSRHYNMPSALLPSIRNWHTLIKPCAGIFASSKFPILVRDFACLLVPSSPSGMRPYEATAPDALAQALIRLMRVPSKAVKNITIKGGIDCAWLAAFAEFVLGLRIEILTCEGTQEYCSSSSHASPSAKIQVTFLKSDAAKPEIDLARKFLVLPIGRDLSQINIDTASQNQMNLIRSPWTSILIDSFGESAHILLHDPVISDYFGRILVYASQEDTKTHQKPRNGKGRVFLKMRHCMHSRYGDDLLDFAAWRLPELKPILEKATAHQKHHVTLRMANEAMRGLTVACCCNRCNNTDSYNSCRCLLQVTGTIVKMVSILSMTNVHELNPIAFGVQGLYRDELNRTAFGGQGICEGEFETHENLHSKAHNLFSTSTTLRNHPKVSPSAVAEDGVCSFFGLLTDPKLPLISTATVTVMPGHIEYSGSLFEKIEDLPLRSDTFSAGLVSFELGPRKTFDLLISETADFHTLQAVYRSQDNSTESPCHFTVGKIIGGLVRSYEPIKESDIPPLYTATFLGVDHEENCPNQGNDHLAKYWIQKSQKLSVIVAIRSRTKDKYLNIHKTSSDFSDPANNHQLYAEYQRFGNDVADRNLFIGFTYVSDCPACIFSSLNHCWVGNRIIADWNGCSCSITIHRSGQPPRTISGSKIRPHFVLNISDKDTDEDYDEDSLKNTLKGSHDENYDEASFDDDLKGSHDDHHHEDTHEKATMKTNLKANIRTALKTMTKSIMRTVTRTAKRTPISSPQ